ncbi:UNVERIFIED_CONTAM: hypothetical protein PYX00_007300 [Menopon gallinae]
MSKTDMKRGEKRFRSKMNRKHWRDYRLHELEKQLEFAESRCGTLKQQLDYIKVLYGCGKPVDENNGPPEHYDKGENPGLLNGVRQISLDDISRWKNIDGEFAEEGGGKNFLPQSVSWTNTTQASTNSSNKPISSKSSLEKKELVVSIDIGAEPCQQKSSIKLAKGKKKKTASKHKLKTKEVEPKFSNATCQTKQDAVVEIYKNAAVNIESESAADVSYRNKRQKMENPSGKSKKSPDSNERLVPAAKLNAFTTFKSVEKVHLLKEECVQTELAEKENVTKNDKSHSIDSMLRQNQNPDKMYYEPEPVKSYCQPTISSKKKRVERNILANLNNINLKNIPFIAATSTAPSHNIGVNIQQVLSIMKKHHANPNSDMFPVLSDHAFGDSASQLPVGCRGNVQELNDAELNRGDFVPETDSKKKLDSSKSNTSQRKNSDRTVNYPLKSSQEEMTDENDNPDWMCKVQRLKKVLVFLHEDFTSLSQ